MKDNKIVITRDNVKEEYYKLAEFNSILTNKDYVIYTDNEYTDGKLNVYCNVVKRENDNIIFDVLDEVDKKEFEKALKELLDMKK